MKKIFAAALAAAVFLCARPAAAETASPPSVSARSAIVMEASTETVLYEKNADAVLPMASTTKLMTALVAAESCDLDAVVTVPEAAVGVEGSSVYLKKGERITVRELLYGALLSSGNDAAQALAYHCGNGDLEKFVSGMNERARQMGLIYTNFENPSGLPADGHQTTARELAQIGLAVSRNKFLAEVVATESVTLRNADGFARRYENHNSLLKLYEYADGMKTGFTKTAGRCLVSSATKNGIKLICVTLHAPDDWNDHMRMMEYAFSRLSMAQAAAAGELSRRVPLGGGTEAFVTVENPAPVELLAVDGRLPDYTTEFSLPKYVFAPVKKGQVLGAVRYRIGDRVVASVPLAAAADAEGRPAVSGWEKFRKNFCAIVNLVLP